MPRKAIDYTKSCLYKICCKDPDITDFYIGSTTDLTRRRCKHKQNCINPNTLGYNSPVYQYIRENGGWDNWEVVKIENYDCNCSEDLCKRERELFEELKPTLNKIRPIILAEEREELKKDSSKKFYEKNKEQFKKYGKEYRENNKESISQYQKEYNIKNKESISQSQKEYREKNKNKISQKNKEKVQCECGSVVSRGSLSRHCKNNKHKKLLAIINK